MLEKFLSKIIVDKTNECWNWGGSICPSTHYGRFSFEGKRTGAHRVSYELFNGTLNKGMFIDHKCRNRKCVNPDHLRQVTPRINSIENSLGVTAINAARTHCKQGHLLIDRYCDPCHRQLSKDWESRNREHRNAYSRNKRKLARSIGKIK